LPAIEVLHSAWSKRATRDKYSSFEEAINAATAKLAEYYSKTASSDAHIIAMSMFQTLLIIELTLI
jgi:hypothetical protein